MGYGATTIGFGSNGQPVSTTVDFDFERIYITYYNDSIAKNSLDNCSAALPHRFNTALSEIESNWLSGSRAIQAWAKAGKPQEVAIIFENESRLLVGTTVLVAEALDGWIFKAFGVRVERNSK